MSALPALEPLPPHLARIADGLREVTVEISGAGGGGAGIVWARDLVVTNAHVARAACLRVGLADGRHVEGHLVVADRRADLAVLRVAEMATAPAALSDPDRLRVGALVVALGNPFGLSRTITAGIVHALAPAGAGRRRFIHADLRLAPGNSGGPLADAAGRVVGINTMMAGGLALAIPIDDVRRFVVSAAPGST
ncbi:MAG TPA: trypsin-like peptidase domain-containing protein [Methylomirabilota bacterium]